jgi:hypothetical protein
VTATRRAPAQLARARVRCGALSPSAGSLGARVRIELDSLRVEIGGATVRSSTTIGSVGGYVVVVATTVSDQALGLTSCYLGQLDGAIAASHLRLGPGGYERLSAQVLPRAPHVAEHARACLLDHAAELQQAIADLTGAEVLVDVAASALERAVEAWGPATPDA